MSEPKLISPLLDKFIMGDPISDHDGVRCCPAMNKETDEKYIVKVISVPASQTQIDALLLSGAYENKESALSYYKALAEGIADEAKTLQNLSQLEGFLPYEGCQIQPMDNDQTGYDIYLLGTYKYPLSRLLKQKSMTHLAALNLALDLCAALTVCRRAGYLYVDLKPENVYILNENGYRIGDLGFIKLDSLKYTSMPVRYLSKYTAPEITDAFSSLNTTLDVYALGLILYQVFNDGNLPFNDDSTDELTPPAYADYEMAEIIMKACAPDPTARWKDPVEMGQALVSYMQRNGAHDVPIVPLPVVDTEEVTETFEPDTDANSSETNIEADSTLDSDADQLDEACELNEDTVDHNNANEPVNHDVASEELTNDVDSAETDSDSTEEDPAEITESSIYSEDEDGNLTFLDSDADDETAPDPSDAEIAYDEVSMEVSDILSQADELIAHPAPEPVVQPEPIDVPIPEPIPVDVEESTETVDDAQDNVSESDSDTVEQSVEASAEDETAETPVKKHKSRWFVRVIIALILLGLAAGGFYYYKNYYLQPIDSIILEETDEGVLTVSVTSSLDESKLTVLCSDTYGNQLTSSVKDGKAVFTGLSPSSAYTVKVVATGFYRLTGDTSAAYTTPAVTSILHLRAVTGSEDGSVILGFTVDGPDSDQWKVTYVADDGSPAEAVFSGHMVTIPALTVGNEYTFTLMPVDDVYTTGENIVTHTASKIVKTDKVMITGCVDKTLTAAWSTPNDITVDSWTVRCYNDGEFDQTITTSDTNASFQIPNPDAGYTVEVTAAGMSVSERAYAAANSITVSDFEITAAEANSFTMSWKSTITPADGWLIQYTVDDGATKEVSSEDGNQFTISPVIPGGKYAFDLQAKDGTSVLGGLRQYTAPEATKFEGYGVTADSMNFYMCRTPSNSDWNRHDLNSYDYVTEFTTEERASFLVKMMRDYDSYDETVTTLFVIRNRDGKVVSASSVSDSWSDMWYNSYCEMDIHSLPQEPGGYTISVYFNGMLAHQNDFTVVSG